MSTYEDTFHTPTAFATHIVDDIINGNLTDAATCILTSSNPGLLAAISIDILADAFGHSDATLRMIGLLS